MFLLLAQETKTVTKTVVTYNTEITILVAVLVLAWLSWYLINRFLRAQKMCRKSRRSSDQTLKNIRRVKNELSSDWLRRGRSKKIHAIGVGKLENGEFCIQVFVDDSNENMFESAGEPVPASYKNIPLVLIEIPRAFFLAGQDPYGFTMEEYRSIVRGKQDVLMGGISGANSNLSGQCGTIGYFVRRKSFLPRKGDICLLSNSHVFVDLQRSTVADEDLIMQPSPGEPGENRPVGSLLDFTKIKLDNDTDDANHVDAAIAKLWKQQEYRPMIPMIGKIKGYVKKDDVEIGENVCKFGRTTGFTCGDIFSICLDIKIGYAHAADSDSLFRDQLLIRPDESRMPKFVEKGDSGSLLVDEENYAAGLIFAGANGSLKLRDLAMETVTGNKAMLIAQVNGYGVANPISDVLKTLGLELV